MKNALLLAFAAICEELFFRGFLLFSNKRYGVIISAVVFSLMHLVSLKSVDTAYIMVLLLLAFSAGVAYAFITIFTKSIIPCIILHILTNITASGDADLNLLIMCSIFYLVYTAVYVYINKKMVEDEK